MKNHVDSMGLTESAFEKVNAMISRDLYALMSDSHLMPGD